MLGFVRVLVLWGAVVVTEFVEMPLLPESTTTASCGPVPGAITCRSARAPVATRITITSPFVIVRTARV